MKSNNLALLGVISFFASVLSVSGYAAEVPALSTSMTGSNTSSSGAKTVVAQMQSAARSGTFVAAEKPTTGTARIITENGRRYLVLDAAFKTSDQGPDLHVVLDAAQKPPQSYQDQTRFLNLGKLQKFSGTQRYPIPAGVNIANYKSVVIWCRMANATFGYASLGSGTGTARNQ